MLWRRLTTAWKYLTIELYEDISHHGFRISNNGPEIPEEDMSCIFEPGFTTILKAVTVWAYQ